MRTSKQDFGRISEEKNSLNLLLKNETSAISKARTYNEAIRLGCIYQREFNETFLTYDEVCPEEGGTEDEIFNLRLETYETLLEKAKIRAAILQKNELACA